MGSNMKRRGECRGLKLFHLLQSLKPGKLMTLFVLYNIYNEKNNSKKLFSYTIIYTNICS
jgi:hypothetical protein